jgi:hypothetical protein
MKGGGIPSTLLTSLYAVYKAESNANDSLATYNGTAQGGLTYTAGKSGNAFTFNGTTGLVALANSSFDFAGDFSISAWVKITSDPSSRGTIFSNYNFDFVYNYGYFLYLNANKTITFATNNAVNSQVVITSTTALTLNTWYNITIKRDSVNKSNYLYINGTLEAQAINTGVGITYGTRAIQPTIGAIRQNNQGTLSSSNFLNGSVDELNIWNKQLTATEVTELYNSGAGKFYPTY